MGVLLTHIIWWTGMYTVATNVIVPVLDGIVEGTKDAIQELRKEKKERQNSKEGG